MQLNSQLDSTLPSSEIFIARATTYLILKEITIFDLADSAMIRRNVPVTNQQKKINQNFDFFFHG